MAAYPKDVIAAAMAGRTSYLQQTKSGTARMRGGAWTIRHRPADQCFTGQHVAEATNGRRTFHIDWQDGDDSPLVMSGPMARW